MRRGEQERTESAMVQPIFLKKLKSYFQTLTLCAYALFQKSVCAQKRNLLRLWIFQTTQSPTH